MNIIQQLEKEQMDAVRATRSVPDFGPGDTLRVTVKVEEVQEADPKDKKKKKDAGPVIKYRNQAYEGVCISRSGAGLNESFTVRKISYGEGVERVFPVYSPLIAEIEVLRRGAVRRAKLYYLRGRRGKAARILERTDARAARQAEAFKGFKRPKGNPDDLSQISGVTPEIAKRLNEIGVIQFAQIAQFSDDDIANVDEALKLGGAIEKGNWVGQATAKMAEATAGEAAG